MSGKPSHALAPLASSEPGLLVRWSAKYGASFPFYFAPLLEVAFDHLQDGLSAHSLVVDAGCGGGHVTATFREAGSRVIGIDVHLPTLRELHDSYPDVQIVAGDIEALPLPTGSVDALFSFATLQYVDRRKALVECSRVLKPGGRFAIVENLANNPIAKAYRALHRISGRRYPENLSPRHHLSWNRRGVYETCFSTVRYEAFHLVTPIFLLSRAASGAPGASNGAGARNLVGALGRLERKFTRALPFARAACWHVVAYGTK